MACPFNKQNPDNDAFYAVPNRPDNGLSYAEYLQLDKLLDNVQPLSEVHDEHLFIIVHQVYELWFKQILYELDSIREIFMSQVVDDRHMLKVNTRLTRVVKIMTVLVDQMKVMETMTPMDFSDFRYNLKSSSGFQSYQFRLLENKLGVKKENRISYNQQNYSCAFAGSTRENVEESEKSTSIFQLIECTQFVPNLDPHSSKQSLISAYNGNDVINHLMTSYLRNAWLERNPALEDPNINFWGKFEANCRRWFEDQSKLDLDVADPVLKASLHKAYEKNKENFETILVQEKYEASMARGERSLSWKALKGALMIYYYRDEILFHDPYQMMSLLMDIDSLLVKWRSNHVLMVQRMLGTKSGSGGSSGYQYLRATISDRYKAFLDFFNLSNYLIPREYIPDISNGIHIKLTSVIMPFSLRRQNKKTEEMTQER